MRDLTAVDFDWNDDTSPRFEAASIVDRGSSFEGTFRSQKDLRVEGELKGTIACDGTLTARNSIYIAEDAEVDATLQASHVVVAGLVRGAVHCLERFEVLPRGRVSGDVRAPRMVIHEGAVIAGKVVMTEESTAHLAPVRAARGG